MGQVKDMISRDLHEDFGATDTLLGELNIERMIVEI